MKEGKINEDDVDILIGCRCGDRLLWRLTRREILSDVSEGNAKIIGRSKKEEIFHTHLGDIKGTVQGRDLREVAHVAVSIYHRLSDTVR